MKKLSAAISAACLGLVGFGSSAVAGIPILAPDFACNSSGEVCAGPDLYEVSLNCDNAEGSFVGGLSIGWDGDGTFDLFVADDGFGIVCEMHGFLDSPKTEGKCTEADKGSNKPGKKHYSPDQKQVDFEIKRVEVGAEECLIELG